MAKVETRKDGTEVHYQADGVTIDYTKDKNGNETHYNHDNGKTIAFTKDKDGNVVYYFADGETIDYTEDKDGNKFFYQEDGKTIASIKDKEGNEVYYQKDGKTINYTKDKDGNEVHYLEDGRTIAFTKDKNGNRADYKDGIRKNMLARARFKVASMLGLGDVELPGWVKEAEDKASRKIEAAKNKLGGKTKKTTVQKPIRTNGGRS